MHPSRGHLLWQCHDHSGWQHAIQCTIWPCSQNAAEHRSDREPGGSLPTEPGTHLTHTHRLREISIQAMVEGSARARLGRALNTRTTLSAQRLNLQVGEEVDVYRAPSNKDSFGWEGPAEVIDVSRVMRGVVSVKHNSHVKEVQLSNVRRHLHFITSLSPEGESGGSLTTEALTCA